MISNAVIGFVALQHLAFLALEMFLWTKPVGRAVFGTTQAFAQASAALAMNQGLYNGFLAAGLIWSLLITSAAESYSFKVFFLGCVIVAGIFGGVTVNLRILFVQALPAALGMALVLTSN